MWITDYHFMPSALSLTQAARSAETSHTLLLVSLRMLCQRELAAFPRGLHRSDPIGTMPR